MGKFKPFLFGALLGAGVVFIGLQYHIVQSHEGVRVVPRTPQHAIGLAYVDIRNWGAEQWTDRPELARALVAHGSTDLVASSVTEGLVESISSESVILDELRGFVNGSSDTDDVDSLFNDSDFAPINAPSDSDSQGLISIPFEDARRKHSTDAASTGHNVKRPSLASRDTLSWKQRQAYRSQSIAGDVETTSPREFSSADDVFGSRRNTDQGQRAYGTVSPEIESGNDAGELSAQQETNVLENMLFGDEVSPSRTSRITRGDERNGGFEDITSTLDNRAEQALNRARSGFQQSRGHELSQSTDLTNRYTRDSSSDSYSNKASDSYSNKTPGRYRRSYGSSAPDTDSASSKASNSAYDRRSTTQLPAPLKALRDGFDPFVE
ncbi:MAG: hypothetical protein P8J37_02310 [Fuerstiella sp.]|nr:hypothetical protein [Fuerstiella sp.]